MKGGPNDETHMERWSCDGHGRTRGRRRPCGDPIVGLADARLLPRGRRRPRSHRLVDVHLREFENESSFKGPFVVLASALGGLALVLVIVGLVTGTETPFLLLAVVIENLWAATTLHHSVSARHAGPRRHAALA